MFTQLASFPYKDLFIQHLLGAVALHGSGEYIAYDNPDETKDPYHFKVKYHIDNAIDLSGPGALGFFPPLPGQDMPIAGFASTWNQERPKHDFPCSGGSSTVEVIAHMPATAAIMGHSQRRSHQRAGTYL